MEARPRTGTPPRARPPELNLLEPPCLIAGDGSLPEFGHCRGSCAAHRCAVAVPAASAVSRLNARANHVEARAALAGLAAAALADAPRHAPAAMAGTAVGAVARTPAVAGQSLPAAVAWETHAHAAPASVPRAPALAAFEPAPAVARPVDLQRSLTPRALPRTARARAWDCCGRSRASRAAVRRCRQRAVQQMARERPRPPVPPPDGDHWPNSF